MIVVRLQVESVATRFPCCICGGTTEKHKVYPIAFREDGTELGFVCDGCMAAGSEKLTLRAFDRAEPWLNRADEYRQRAEDLVGTVLPTMNEWEAAEKRLGWS